MPFPVGLRMKVQPRSHLGFEHLQYLNGIAVAVQMKAVAVSVMSLFWLEQLLQSVIANTVDHCQNDNL